MLSSFLIGTAIVLGLFTLYGVGTAVLSELLRRHLGDEVRVARYWGVVFGAWTMIVSLAFGFVTLTDLGQPISKFGPFVSGLGILFGLKLALTKFKPNEDRS